MWGKKDIFYLLIYWSCTLFRTDLAPLRFYSELWKGNVLKCVRRKTRSWNHFLLYCEGRKELVHTTVRLQLILFSKITGTFWFRIFGGFLHVPTTQIYCLTDAVISETHKIIITIHNTKCDPPQYYSCWGCKGTVSHPNVKAPIQHLLPVMIQGEGTLPLSLSQVV